MIVVCKQRKNAADPVQSTTPLHTCFFLFSLIYFQGKQRDNTPYGEYGGWYKACKVNR